MKVGIEAQRLLRKHKHGMDMVALHLIEELPRIAPEHEYVVFVRPGEDEQVLERLHNVKIVRVKSLNYADWEQIWLPRAIAKEQVDVMHFTSNTASMNCPVPFILTLHDIIYLEPSQAKSKSFYQRLGAVYRKWNVPLVTRKASKVVTVSGFEYRQIAHALPAIEEKLSFIYNAVDTNFGILQSKNSQLLKALPERFYFFLGNTDPKKNTANVLKAFVHYRKNLRGTLKLVMGDFSRSYLQDLLAQANALDLQDEIVTLGYISNQDLPVIYKKATGFLYPSLRESFGIPILEAMACGCPVITSNTSSMPEIAGDAAILVSPSDVNGIGQSLWTLEKNNDVRMTMRSRGFCQVKKFHWAESARQYAALYQQAA